MDQDQQQERAQMEAMVLQNLEDHKRIQLNCTHRHAAREGLFPHYILISRNVDHSKYLLCQKCLFKVAPEPNQGAHGMVYDTALFNKMVNEYSADSNDTVWPDIRPAPLTLGVRFSRWCKSLTKRVAYYKYRVIKFFQFTPDDLDAMSLDELRTLNTKWKAVYWFQKKVTRAQ